MAAAWEAVLPAAGMAAENVTDGAVRECLGVLEGR